MVFAHQARFGAAGHRPVVRPGEAARCSLLAARSAIARRNISHACGQQPGHGPMPAQGSQIPLRTPFAASSICCPARPTLQPECPATGRLFLSILSQPPTWLVMAHWQRKFVSEKNDEWLCLGFGTCTC